MAKSIGVLINGFDGSYQQGLLDGLRQAARRLGVHILCFPGSELANTTTFEREFNMLYELAARAELDGILSVTGSFIWSVAPEEAEEFFERYRDIPLVSIGRGLPGMPAVITDNRSGMTELVDHFIHDHGFRRIAFIGGPEHSVDARERQQVFVDCHKRAGISLDPDLILPGRFYHVSGQEAVERLIAEDRMPEAIIAANDEMALSAISALMEHGFRVPEDVAVAGFDDLGAQLRQSPSLSSVHQDIAEQALLGLEALLRRIEGEDLPMETQRPTWAILRRSCGCTGARLALNRHGSLWEDRGQAEADLDVLREALLADLSDPTTSVFQETFERLARQARCAQTRSNDLRNVLTALHKEAADHPEIDQPHLACSKLFEAQSWLAEFERLNLTDELLERLFPPWLLSYILRMRLPSSGTSLRTMLRLLREGLADFGVSNAYLVLYPQITHLGDWRSGDLPAEGQLAMALRKGDALDVSNFGRFPIERLLPLPLFHEEEGVVYTVLPLFQQIDHYGYLILDITRPLGIRIEPLREAIATLVTSTIMVNELTQAHDLLREDLDRAYENNQQLAILAEQDELTGLLNRRGFFSQAEGLQVNRTGSLLLITADMDGLKFINDHFGHAAGDQALRDLAGLLKNTFRADDSVARLGGDEFAVLSRHYSPEIVARVRARIEARIAEYNASSPHDWELGVSLGFTEIPGNDKQSLEERLDLADRLLYEEKRRRKAQRSPA